MLIGSSSFLFQKPSMSTHRVWTLLNKLASARNITIKIQFYVWRRCQQCYASKEGNKHLPLSRWVELLVSSHWQNPRLISLQCVLIQASTTEHVQSPWLVHYWSQDADRESGSSLSRNLFRSELWHSEMRIILEDWKISWICSAILIAWEVERQAQGVSRVCCTFSWMLWNTSTQAPVHI